VGKKKKKKKKKKKNSVNEVPKFGPSFWEWGRDLRGNVEKRPKCQISRAIRKFLISKKEKKNRRVFKSLNKGFSLGRKGLKVDAFFFQLWKKKREKKSAKLNGRTFEIRFLVDC